MSSLRETSHSALIWLTPGVLMLAVAARPVLAGEDPASVPECHVLFGEDFTTGGGLPAGWEQQTLFGSVSWQVAEGNPRYDRPSRAWNGAWCVHFSQDSYARYCTALISPPINLRGQPRPTLTFHHMMEAWAGDVDELQVFVETAPGEPWIPLATYRENTPAWTLRTLDLPAHEGSVRLVFAATANYGYGVHLDAIRVTGCKPLSTPGTLVAPMSPEPGCRLAWAVRQGYTYRVLAAPAVEGPYEIVADGLTSTQAVAMLPVTVPDDTRVRFFRIAEMLPGQAD